MVGGAGFWAAARQRAHVTPATFGFVLGYAHWIRPQWITAVHTAARKGLSTSIVALGRPFAAVVADAGNTEHFFDSTY